MREYSAGYILWFHYNSAVWKKKKDNTWSEYNFYMNHQEGKFSLWTALTTFLKDRTSIALLFYNPLIVSFPKVAVILTCFNISKIFFLNICIWFKQSSAESILATLVKSSELRLHLATFWESLSFTKDRTVQIILSHREKTLYLIC